MVDVSFVSSILKTLLSNFSTEVTLRPEFAGVSLLSLPGAPKIVTALLT